MWTWLRNRVRDCFLAGINDALAELDAGAPADLAPALAALQVRLLPPPAAVPPREPAPLPQALAERLGAAEGAAVGAATDEGNGVTLAAPVPLVPPNGTGRGRRKGSAP